MLTLGAAFLDNFTYPFHVTNVIYKHKIHADTRSLLLYLAHNDICYTSISGVSGKLWLNCVKTPS
jgi:hypothetical protein